MGGGPEGRANQRIRFGGEFPQVLLDFLLLVAPREVAVRLMESYGANCIWVNGTVIMPAGYPVSRGRIAALGYPVIEVDTSEFRKLDGGVSCMSLRFPDEQPGDGVDLGTAGGGTGVLF